jgi:hypothetical protein
MAPIIATAITLILIVTIIAAVCPRNHDTITSRVKTVNILGASGAFRGGNDSDKIYLRRR